jgi:hypothetical protein
LFGTDRGARSRLSILLLLLFQQWTLHRFVDSAELAESRAPTLGSLTGSNEPPLSKNGRFLRELGERVMNVASPS